MLLLVVNSLFESDPTLSSLIVRLTESGDDGIWGQESGDKGIWGQTGRFCLVGEH